MTAQEFIEKYRMPEHHVPTPEELHARYEATKERTKLAIVAANAEVKRQKIVVGTFIFGVFFLIGAMLGLLCH